MLQTKIFFILNILIYIFYLLYDWSIDWLLINVQWAVFQLYPRTRRNSMINKPYYRNVGWIGQPGQDLWLPLESWVETINLIFCSGHNVNVPIFFYLNRQKRFLMCRDRGHLQKRYPVWSTPCSQVFRIINWHPLTLFQQDTPRAG